MLKGYMCQCCQDKGVTEQLVHLQGVSRVLREWIRGVLIGCVRSVERGVSVEKEYVLVLSG